MIKKETLSTLQLSPRLMKIAQLLPVCHTIADIGTDHAYIPIFAILNQRAKRAIASDINAGPVERARVNVAEFGLDEKISLRLGAGLETLSPNEAEVICISGMGGILISEIINSSLPIAANAKRLILQPMTAAKELREYLCQNGFFIEEEVLVCEEDKIYNILSVTFQKGCVYSEKELVVGRYSLNTDEKLLERHKNQILKKLKIKLKGLEKSRLEENKNEAQEVGRLISLIEE